MILVAGGTGRLGTLVVNRLVSGGISVRVLTRNPAHAAHLIGDHVEVVTGDVRDPASLAPATAGVDVVVSAVHGFTGVGGNSPATVDRDGNANLLDATQAAGADFVLLSTVRAAPDSPMELFRMKHAAEDLALDSCIPTTIIRATAFLELWIELMQQTAARSGRPLVFGRGDNPINFVSVGDVAALVERAATDPATRGTTLEIGGPDNLTFNELAHAIQTAEGRTGAPRHVPPAMLHVMANTVGRVKPLLGRQARAALAMDRTDLTFDAASLRRDFPDLPSTRLSEVLATVART
jgi:NADH dehydrogenase